MFKAKKSRIAELENKVVVLESNLSAMERQRSRMLSPLNGLRQQGYNEGLAEGIKQGREMAQQEELARTTVAHIGCGCNPLHEHDFNALELRVLALELAGKLPDGWAYHGRTRGVWSGRAPALQNLPKHMPVYRYFRSEHGEYRWRFRVGSEVNTKAELNRRDGHGWVESAKTVKQIMGDRRLRNLGNEPAWLG